jgi:hypothetical protein
MHIVVAGFSKTSANIYQTMPCHIPEYSKLKDQFSKRRTPNVDVGDTKKFIGNYGRNQHNYNNRSVGTVTTVSLCT